MICPGCVVTLLAHRLYVALIRCVVVDGPVGHTSVHCDRGPRAWGSGECARLCFKSSQVKSELCRAQLYTCCTCDNRQVCSSVHCAPFRACAGRDKTLTCLACDFTGLNGHPPRVWPPGYCACTRPLPPEQPSDVVSCKFSRGWPCRQPTGCAQRTGPTW